MLRVLLADDEQTARDRLRQMLAVTPGVEVAGEAADGEEAIARIAELHPDVVLLDIQMPGCNGLEVVASLSLPRPKIIFCTAFDQYAVDAFDLHAVDYLLKPVTQARLVRAIERVRKASAPEVDSEVERMLKAMRGTACRVLAHCGDRYRVVPQQEILYFSSESGLTRVHTAQKQYVLDPTLNDLEERLDPAVFFRVNRAAIVNLDAVAEVLTMPGGMADLLFRNGGRLEVSRRRLKDLIQRLNSIDQPGDAAQV